VLSFCQAFFFLAKQCFFVAYLFLGAGFCLAALGVSKVCLARRCPDCGRLGICGDVWV
jgi:hypothetical protein